jgi:hypothetical protein
VFSALVFSMLGGACGEGSSMPGDANDPTTYDCGTTRCALDTEACVWPRLDAARCEPALSPEKMGTERCRDHLDAYCGGLFSEPCGEGGGTSGRPDGAYDVFCG